MNTCEWCNITEDEKRWLLFEMAEWSVYLADEQNYVGRYILVLHRHTGNLSELSMHEWSGLKEIIDRLEVCYKELLGAELCNWCCLMNNFYRAEEPNPHLHIHVQPRYKQGAVIGTTSYFDAEYGHHYALKKKNVLNEIDRGILFERMKEHLLKLDSDIPYIHR